MRIVTWMLMGIGAGALAGFVSALLRRRHHSMGEPVAEYAGGYTAPVASEDRTASHPANRFVTDSSAPSVTNRTGHANGARQPQRVDHAPAADRIERAGQAGRGGHG
jgi:hypothetical protein